MKNFFVFVFIASISFLATSEIHAQPMVGLIPVNDSTQTNLEAMSTYPAIHYSYDKSGNVVFTQFNNIETGDSSITVAFTTHAKNWNSTVPVTFYKRRGIWMTAGKYLDKSYTTRLTLKALDLLKGQ